MAYTGILGLSGPGDFALTGLDQGTNKDRVTQLVLETLAKYTAKARITQSIIEVLSSRAAKARITQQPIEVLANYTAKSRHTQIVIEVLRSTNDVFNETLTLIANANVIFDVVGIFEPSNIFNATGNFILDSNNDITNSLSLININDFQLSPENNLITLLSLGQFATDDCISATPVSALNLRRSSIIFEYSHLLEATIILCHRLPQGDSISSFCISCLNNKEIPKALFEIANEVFDDNINLDSSAGFFPELRKSEIFFAASVTYNLSIILCHRLPAGDAIGSFAVSEYKNRIIPDIIFDSDLSANFIFRRTLSPIGTRTGSRQIHQWG